MSSNEVGLGVAVAQFAPGPDKAANLARMTDLAREAVYKGVVDLIVFPEYSSFFLPVLGESFLVESERLDGPFVTALTALATETGTVIVAGLVEYLADDPRHVANTVVAVAPNTGLVATHHKQRLYDAFGQRESDWIAAASHDEPLGLFELKDFKVGIQTCYELRFPEITAELVDAGADLVLVPSEWVRGPLKEHHWRTLVTARAIENTAYLAAADHPAPVGVGSSMIVDPMGVTVAGLGENDAMMAIAWIERRRLTEVREQNPVLRLRGARA